MCAVPEMLRPTSHGMRAGGAQPQEPCGTVCCGTPWWDGAGAGLMRVEGGWCVGLMIGSCSLWDR